MLNSSWRRRLYYCQRFWITYRILYIPTEMHSQRFQPLLQGKFVVLLLQFCGDRFIADRKLECRLAY